MTTAAQPHDQEIARRIAATSPEQLASMLLRAGQKYLGQAVQAIARKDHAGKGQALARVSEIIAELSSHLNREAPGELVHNLSRIYEWWTCELVLASLQQQAEPYEAISRWMGELNDSWEQLHRIKMAHVGSMGPRLQGASA